MASAAPVEDQVLTPAADNDGGDHGSGAPQLSEVEALAAEMGWEPQASYNGDPTKWRPATDWIKSTNANNRNLKREVKDLKASVERIVAVADKQVKREVQEQLAEIQSRFESAVENKDKAGAAEAVKDLRKLEQEQAPPASNDVEADFAKSNPWYGTDEDATEYAIAQSRLQAKKGNTDPAKQLEAVLAAVKKRFPEHFEDGKAEPKPQAGVNAPSSRAVSAPRTKTFADMAPAAKAACERFYEAAKARGRDIDKAKFQAQYAKDYFEDQPA